MATKKELKTLIETNSIWDFISKIVGDDFEGSVGLRGLYSNEGLGMLEDSFAWDDGEMTDFRLSGTCVVGLSEYFADGLTEKKSQIKEVFSYGDGRVGLVIGSLYPERGYDEWANELIIKNAEVVFIWE